MIGATGTGRRRRPNFRIIYFRRLPKKKKEKRRSPPYVGARTVRTPAKINYENRRFPYVKVIVIINTCTGAVSNKPLWVSLTAAHNNNVNNRERRGRNYEGRRRGILRAGRRTSVPVSVSAPGTVGTHRWPASENDRHLKRPCRVVTAGKRFLIR